MKRTTSFTTTLALVTVASLVCISATPAGPATNRQRVAVEAKKIAGPGDGTFVLTTLGPGPLKPDSGTFTDSVSQKNVVRSGQSVLIFTATSTWTGKQGTLVLQLRIDDVAAGNGYRVGTGMWSLLSARGTGQYAGLNGSGRLAYVATPKAPIDHVSIRYEGVVTKR